MALRNSIVQERSGLSTVVGENIWNHLSRKTENFSYNTFNIFTKICSDFDEPNSVRCQR